jgi:hypothetical protein
MLSRFATLGGGGDPYWDNVSLLLPGNNFTDMSKVNNTLTQNGSITISTTTTKYNSGSIYFPNTTAYSSIPANVAFNFGTGDYTIEFWTYRPSSLGIYAYASGQIIGCPIRSNFTPFWLQNGKPAYYDGTEKPFSSTALSMDTWHYIVVQRISGVVSCYVDGLLQPTTYSSAASYTSSEIINIGRDYYSSVGSTFLGNCSDLRITKGVARYSGSTMTVPTGPLPIG